MLNNLKKNKILSFHILVLFIFSGSLYTQFKAPFLLCVLYMTFFATWYFFKSFLKEDHKFLKTDKNIFYLLTVLLVFIANSGFVFFNKSHIVNVCGFVVSMSFLICILKEFRIDKIERIFLEWLYLFSGGAFLLFLIGVAFFDYIQRLPIVNSRFVKTTWAFGPFFYQQYNDILGLKFWRSQLFFWEPAILGLYLFVGVIVVLLDGKKTSKIWGVSILTIGIISTFSTTAFVCLGVVLFYKFLSDAIHTKNIFLSVITLIFVLFVCYLGVINIENKTNLNQIRGNAKLLLETSFVKRALDLEFGIRGFLKNPVMGTGFLDSPYVNSGIKEFKGRGLSNGVISIFCYFGIMGLLWFLPFFRCFKFLSGWWYVSFGLFVLVYMGEPLTFFPMFFLQEIVLANKLKIKYKTLVA